MLLVKYLEITWFYQTLLLYLSNDQYLNKMTLELNKMLILISTNHKHLSTQPS